MRLLLVVHQCPWGGGYSSPETGLWPPGEERELEREVAERLLAEFPGVFVRMDEDGPGRVDLLEAELAELVHEHRALLGQFAAQDDRLAEVTARASRMPELEDQVRAAGEALRQLQAALVAAEAERDTFAVRVGALERELAAVARPEAPAAPSPQPAPETKPSKPRK